MLSVYESSIEMCCITVFNTEVTISPRCRFCENGALHVTEVTLRWAGLVLRYVTVNGCTILMCNQQS